MAAVAANAANEAMDEKPDVAPASIADGAMDQAADTAAAPAVKEETV